MSHLDDDTLAAAAMGESLDALGAAHVEACEACREDVRALAAIASRTSSLPALGQLTTPPDRVWDSIAAQIAGEESVAPEPDVAPQSDVVRPIADARARHVAPKRVAWLAAAAAIVVGGVGAGIALSNAKQDTIVASAELVDLATEADAGTAVVEQRRDGTRVLVVTTDVSEVEDADLEVWLIDPNIEGMVSLGFLTANTGEFEIPEGYDVAEFPIVDVSVEPRDGVPTHSGDSVTRGTLAPRA